MVRVERHRAGQAVHAHKPTQVQQLPSAAVLVAREVRPALVVLALVVQQARLRTARRAQPIPTTHLLPVVPAQMADQQVQVAAVVPTQVVMALEEPEAVQLTVVMVLLVAVAVVATPIPLSVLQAVLVVMALNMMRHTAQEVAAAAVDNLQYQVLVVQEAMAVCTAAAAAAAAADFPLALVGLVRLG